MKHQLPLHSWLAVLALNTALINPAIAGGGAATSNAFEGLTKTFNDAADIPTPTRTFELEEEYVPPIIVPGGSTTYSPALVQGATPPRPQLPPVFNRHGADRPAGDTLKDFFNHMVRGN